MSQRILDKLTLQDNYLNRHNLRSLDSVSSVFFFFLMREPAIYWHAVPKRNSIAGLYITSPWCSAHANSFENRPPYTNVNHQNGRALTSARSSVSQIVGYSRRCRCRRSRETNIFPQASRGGNSLPEYTRLAFGIVSRTLERELDDPFLPNDCKYRQICGIVGQIELQRTSLCGSALLCSSAFHAFTRTHAIADRDSRANRRWSCSTTKSLFEGCGPPLPCAFLHSPVVLHYRTDTIWNSISLCVFPMNNIGGISRSRRLHDRDSNNRTRTPRYRKLLIPPLGRAISPI